MIYRTTLLKIKKIILYCFGISAFLAFVFFNLGLGYYLYDRFLSLSTFLEICFLCAVYALYWGLVFAVAMFIFLFIFGDRLE